MGRRANWPPKAIPHKASGQDRVQWKGRTHYLGKSGSAESRARYVELIRELEGKAGPGLNPATDPPPGPPAPGEGTVAQLLALWRVHAIKEYGPESDELNSYRHALRPVYALYGEAKVEAFDALALRRVQTDMVRRGWCRNVVNRSVVRVRTVWRWAEMERIAAPGTWAALRAVPPLNRPRPGLKETAKVQPVAGWRAFRVACLGAAPGLRLLILLGWWTGARPSELSKLRASMIDTSAGAWEARLAEHKNAWRGQERVLYFGPEARALLEARLAELAGADGLVCPNGKGGRFNRRTLYVALRRACVRSGVAPWHAYQLRHAAKRRLVRAVGIDAARAVLGQRSLSSTEQYAAGIDAQAARGSAQKAG